MARIGPTFAGELVAAGISLDGVSWDPDAGTIIACPDAVRARVEAVLTTHDPTRTIALPPAVTGNQWAFALGDLGLADAWLGGVARSKGKDRNRIGLISRTTPLLATDPLLIRVAANAGTDASGKALIDVAAVFARALTEPT